MVYIFYGRDRSQTFLYDVKYFISIKNGKLIYFCRFNTGYQILQLMSEFQNVWKPKRKSLLNIVYFIVSTIIVVTIWPYGEGISLLKVTGTLILVSSCYLVLYLFLAHFRSEVFKVTRKTLFVILIILTFVTLTRIVITYADQKMLFLIPVVIIPIVIRTFYDARMALFILLITMILSGFMIPDPFLYIFMSFISGMVAIYTLTNIYRRAKLFFTSLMVVISYSALYLGVSLMHDGSFHNVKLYEFCLFAGNGLLNLLSYPVLFIFENKFLFLSDTTLLELADINQPLLRKFADEAPGSFQHSVAGCQPCRGGSTDYWRKSSPCQNRRSLP